MSAQAPFGWVTNAKGQSHALATPISERMVKNPPGQASTDDEELS